MNAVTFAKKESVAAAPSRQIRIGEPGDAYEREAERVADEIQAGGTRTHHWSLPRANPDPPALRRCSCGASSSAEGECAGCRQQREAAGQTLRRKAADGFESAVAPPIVHRVLSSPGQPLDRATRDYFEPRLGQDLTPVRVHSDSVAAESAGAVRAKAYTVGNHIAFAGGQFAPSTSEGRTLLGHELVHVVQQRRTSFSSSLRRAPGPPTPPVPAFRATAADLDHIEGLMAQLAGKLDPATLKTLQNDKTLAIGLVQDAEGELALVYTVSGDWINPALDKATKSLDITRWDVGEGRRPRGAAGAPGDAEQRMLEAAGDEFVVKGMVVSRKVCPDCVEAIASYEHGPIAVRVGKLKPPPPPAPAAGGPATGGHAPATAPPQPPPKAASPAVEGGTIPDSVSGPHTPATRMGAGGKSGSTEGELPGVPKSVEVPKPPIGGGKPVAEAKPPGGEVKPPAVKTPGAGALLEGTPSGIGPVVAEAGVGAAGFSLSAKVLGFVVEQAIFAAVALALQWAMAKLFEAEVEAEIQIILKPAVAAKLEQLQPKLTKLAGTRKLMVRITYEFVYQRDSEDDPVLAFMQGAPPFYEMGSMRLVNVHPGNEELDFPSSSDEKREHILGARERVTARSSYSVVLDDAPRRLREKQMAAIVEKHRLKEAPPPRKASLPPLASPPSTPLLPSPAPQQAPSEFVPLPGAPGPSPSRDIDSKVDWGRHRCLELIAEGTGLQSNSSSDRGRIQKFLKDESDWRDMVTYSLLHYKNSGPDYARSKFDELLNSDQYGGKLKRIRQNFGG